MRLVLNSQTCTTSNTIAERLFAWLSIHSATDIEALVQQVSAIAFFNSSHLKQMAHMLGMNTTQYKVPT